MLKFVILAVCVMCVAHAYTVRNSVQSSSRQPTPVVNSPRVNVVRSGATRGGATHNIIAPAPGPYGPYGPYARGGLGGLYHDFDFPEAPDFVTNIYGGRGQTYVHGGYPAQGPTYVHRGPYGAGW